MVMAEMWRIPPFFYFLCVLIKYQTHCPNFADEVICRIFSIWLLETLSSLILKPLYRIQVLNECKCLLEGPIIL
jgi:hypothetical protein